MGLVLIRESGTFVRAQTPHDGCARGEKNRLDVRYLNLGGLDLFFCPFFLSHGSRY